MPSSYSQMMMSNMLSNPSVFQTNGDGFSNLHQQSLHPSGVQSLNPYQTQQMIVNPAGAPIQSAMRMVIANTSRISWRNVHDLDVEQLKRSNDIETLESYLPNILDSVVTQEEFEKLKPEALSKLLQICQLSLQYFDYTQDYLENLQGETQDEMNTLQKKIEEDKNQLKQSKQEIQKMKNEIEVKKDALHKYKEFLRQKPQFKCHICVNKFFQNEDYLDQHIKRRHAQILPMNANHPNFAVMQNMVFAQQLQKERQEFERQQRLLLKNEKFNKHDMLDKLEFILQRSKQEQAELQQEMQRRIQEMEKQQVQVINKKQSENDFQKQQIVDFKKNMDKIHNEITDLKHRSVVVQSGVQIGESELQNSQIQQLYQKQNELFEQSQKMKQQQLEQEIKKEKKSLEEKQKLEELKEKKRLLDQSEYNDSLIKQLASDDLLMSKQGSKINEQRSKVPSEFKAITHQISEICGSSYNSANMIDKDDLKDIDLGISSKINQNQKSSFHKQGQNDILMSKQDSKANDQRSKVPSEIKAMTHQISEIRGPSTNNANVIDLDDLKYIDLGPTSKINQNQKSSIPKQDNDDISMNKQRSNNDQKSKIPSEIKAVAHQTSEIPSKSSNNANMIDKNDKKEHLESSSKINQSQKNNIPKQSQNNNTQANKFNSIAANMILSEHNVQNPKNQYKKSIEDEEVPEEGQINFKYQDNTEDEEGYLDSNDNNIFKNRGQNNKKQKEVLDVSNKDKGKHQKHEQNKNEVGKSIDKGKRGSIQKNQVLNNKNNNDDFTEDSQFEQSQGNDNNNKGKQGSQIGKSNTSMNQSNKRSKLEESSQNYDDQGFYDGPKGKTYDQQVNNKNLYSLGDSYQEQEFDEKKAKKKFNFEDSDDLFG